MDTDTTAAERVELARAEGEADAKALLDTWSVERSLGRREAGVVQDWFQFPTAVQTFVALALMTFLGFGWWQATLLAWVASTPAALLMRGAPSRLLLATARVLRSIEALAAIAAGVYFGVTHQWWDLIPAGAALLGLFGMLCPGYVVMSYGRNGLAPKAAFARKWFGVPSQAAGA